MNGSPYSVRLGHPQAAARTARLKSAFVTAFLISQTAIFAHSLWLVGTIGPTLAAGGSALASGVMLGFLATVALSGRPRTSPNLPGVVSISAAGLALSLAGSGSAGSRLPLLYAVVAFAGTLVYVFWYSRLGRSESSLLGVGQALPDFEVQEADGTTLSASTFRGRPTVLVFFRGNWCPLCMAQIREVAGHYRELERRGAQVVLVSPQPHEKTSELAQRFDAPMRFLVDPDNAAARRLGIVHQAGLPLGMQALGYDTDTVLPTVVITDAEGRILFSDQTDNYRVRPEPQTFLRILDAAR
ncbi:MAG: AhpC/TSA family protein [Deltaproteobacteria bacterium]|nr:AhpC/TSA family protein [Deltaproteobacteria bacterium]